MAQERTFTIPSDLIKKFEEWKENLPDKGYDAATIGGRFTFEFTPTGVGTEIWVIDQFTNTAINLTEDVEW
jgi:hypothetical protein